MDQTVQAPSALHPRSRRLAWAALQGAVVATTHALPEWMPRRGPRLLANAAVLAASAYGSVRLQGAGHMQVAGLADAAPATPAAPGGHAMLPTDADQTDGREGAGAESPKTPHPTTETWPGPSPQRFPNGQDGVQIWPPTSGPLSSRRTAIPLLVAVVAAGAVVNRASRRAERAAEARLVARGVRHPRTVMAAGYGLLAALSTYVQPSPFAPPRSNEQAAAVGG